MNIQPYRPSNSTEGEIFESEWCSKCKKEDELYLTGEGGCEILGRALAFMTDNLEYPKEWVRIDGMPQCSAFKKTERK